VVSNVVVFVPCLLLGSTRLTGMSNLSFALWVAIVNLLINQAAYYLIGLPLTRRAVQLPISLVTAAVLLGLAANNIPVAFLVVPIIATLRVIGGYLLAKAAGRDPFQGAAPDTGAYPGFFSQLYTPPPVDAPAPEQRVA
jgi:hypothetical protein